MFRIPAWSWWCVLWCLGFQVAQAQSFSILDARVDAGRRPALEVGPATGSYYILLRGTSPEDIRVPVGLLFGGAAAVTLTDPDSIPATGARFYRVQRRSVTTPGDLDGDGIDDVYELGLETILDPLDPEDAGRDPDGDGISNRDEYLRGTDPLTPNGAVVTTFESSPDQLESGVSVQRETIFRFSRALQAGTAVSADMVYAQSGGRRLLTRAEVSADRRKLTLFYLEPMPGGARVRVHLDGGAIRDEQGTAVDADRDGRPGGLGIVEFDTFGNRPLDTTGVVGQVFASEPVAGAGGEFVNRPLQGVIITVDGAEETLRAVTDAEGRFHLQPAPAGRFFVHIDGRTAVGSAWPNGSYYPFIGKAWEAVPGRTNNPAGENGLIYLPLIAAGSLQPVSAASETAVTFPDAVLNQNPELAGVEVRIPPNALVADDGVRGGRVGIAPVAPDRIPSPLPPGLELPLVITIQTDGPQNFDQPVPVRFPNLPDPRTGRKLGPGEKSALWSFNHDTGQWELVGPMTVTADGNFVETDPGVGVLQPGWHGTQPGVGAGGGPLGGPDPCSGGGGPGAGGERCRQNPDFTPDDPANYNGCGPDGWDYLVPDNPNGLLFPCATFFDACRAHDIGYNTCGRPQQTTDDRFLQDMLAACDCLSGLKRQECRALAVVYHRAVTGGGEGAYNDAQDKACVCEDPPPPPPGCEAGQGGSPTLAGGGAAVMDLSRRLALHGPALAAQHDGRPLTVVPQLGRHRFAVIDVATGEVVQRGRAGAAGVAFSELILAPRTVYDIGILQEETLREGRVRITTGQSGSRLTIPPILVKPPVSWDFDGDDLHDAGELILGTDPQNPDSDGDGVIDGAEVRQGTNPLDGAVLATGILGSVAAPGNAVDITAMGEVLVTANDDAGIALFQAADPFAPVRLAALDTPGRAVAVAAAGTWILVADGSAGAAIVDAAAASAPRLVRQLALGSFARAAAVTGDVGFVGLDNGTLVQVDLRTGSVLQRLSLGTTAVQDLTVAGDMLAALSVGRLSLVPLDGGDLRVEGFVSSPGGLGAGGRRLRVFAAGGLAYATHTSGYNVFDISDPGNPRLVRAHETAQRGWKQMVANGSGYGVATVSANSTDDGAHDVSLYRLGTDGTQLEFVATFATPGLATALVLNNGLAYVADGRSGIQVINYLASDRARTPPVIALDASFPLVPAQAEEGKLVRVSAFVADDVQVRNVEFHVDGRLVTTDGSFGFETRFVTPVRTAERSAFRLRARAVDTGGNSAWSEEYEVQLVADATPPRVIRRFPAAGAIEGQVDLVSATFDEPLRAATVGPQSVLLRGAGADGRFGTGEDIAPAGVTVVWRGDRNTVELRLAETLPGGLYEARLRSTLEDLAGNRLRSDVAWTFWVLGEQDTDRDGVPDAVEAALGTNPDNPDSDGDGITDGDEDFDRDRLRTGWELAAGLDPRVVDSDGNGTPDWAEDQDNDGVINEIEHRLNLNPRSPDTDGDRWDDAGEIASGSDPGSASSVPVIQVRSEVVAYLNAVAETVPAGTSLTALSATASYLNATPETPPPGTPLAVVSPAASYLNAVAETPSPSTRISASSPVVSYLNASPEAPAGAIQVPSPVVSYRNE